MQDEGQPTLRASSYTQFACIGTGFSAIALGATLQRWYGITSVRFFERGPELGGTWSWNRYPGAACDIPSALYSFSFAPNPNWTRILAAAPELRAYIRRVADEYDLSPKMTFHASVERCEWLADTARWRLSVRNVITGEVAFHECQFLFAGTGQFAEPRPLDVPGLERFKGEVVHSARWRDEVDLRGKQVVVFGNGCTGAQIVAAVAAETKRLTHIVRSRHWIMPPVDERIPLAVRRVLQYTPGMLALQRFIIFCVAEADFAAFSTPNAWFRRRRQRVAERYMRSKAPERYHDMLIPDFEYGCKRRIFDSGYLEALHLPNVTLTDEPTAEIWENGVRLGNGEVVEADVIVLANGFQTNDLLEGVEVVGRDGVTLKRHWEEFGGVEAYNCTAVNGFPNFFFTFGPNSVTGHTSAVLGIENSINYALRIIRPLLEGKASVAEVKRSAEEAHVSKVHKAIKEMVWSTGGCKSWYTRPTATSGGEKQVWNGTTYPWWSGRFWCDCLFPVWGDWEYTGSPSRTSIVKQSRRSVWLKSLFVMALGGALLSRWAKARPDSLLGAVAIATARRVAGIQMAGSGESMLRLGRRLASSVPGALPRG